MGAKAVELEALKKNALAEIADAGAPDALESLRVKYVGRKGVITGILRDMGSVAPDERREVGQTANAVKNAVAAALKEREASFAGSGKNAAADRPDITLPGRTAWTGGPHPLTLVTNEIKDIFFGMGFSLATGPDVETDYYNFEALNFPADHPARDMQDTLATDGDYVLRTQTSSVQIRTMEKQRPPVRVIAPGRCYRKDETDATHSPMFQQVEGLYVDKHVTFAQLKGTLLTFARKMFGPDVRIRFRNGFFPFTEPSAEYDISCVICKGAGCRVCGGTGWIEISGAGMVDPNVFGFVDYDPEVYSGFAFGMGIERIAMIKYGVEDIRLFYENDRRFLEQFS